MISFGPIYLSALEWWLIGVFSGVGFLLFMLSKGDDR